MPGTALGAPAPRGHASFFMKHCGLRVSRFPSPAIPGGRKQGSRREQGPAVSQTRPEILAGILAFLSLSFLICKMGLL